MRLRLLLLLLLPGIASAQSMRWENLTEADGLVSPSVSTTTQDAFGFIWIGSWGGVSRFDGKTVQPFQNVPFDSTSIVDSDGRFLDADKRGGVWVSVQNNGLDYFDPETGHFKHYGEEKGVFYSRFNFPFVSSDGSVFATSPKGLLKYSPEQDRFNLLSDQITSGISRLSSAPDGSIHFISFFQRSGDARNAYQLGVLQPDGRIVYESWPSVLPLESTRFRLVVTPLSEPALIGNGFLAIKHQDGGWKRHDIADNTCLENVDSGSFDKKGRLWVVNVEFVCQIDVITRKFKIHRPDPANPNSVLPSAGGSNIFVDRQGIVWVTRFGYGVSRIDPNATAFEVITSANGLPDGAVMAAFENDDGSSWVGMRFDGPNTLVLADTLGNFSSHFGTSSFGALPGTRKDTKLVHPFIWDIEKTSDGTLWVASRSPDRGGISRINTKTKEVVQFGHDPDSEDSIHEPDVGLLEVDGSDDVWVGAWGPGLSWIDSKTNAVKRVFLPDGWDLGSGKQAEVNGIDSAPDGNIWIVSGGKYGLYEVDHETKEIIQFVVPHPREPELEQGLGQIGDVHVDDSNRIWIGSRNSGFGEYDPVSQQMISLYDAKQLGVPSVSVERILSDAFGKIWLATQNGIVRFDPETEKAIHFGLEAGLPGLNLSNSPKHRGASGKLYFGGGGLVIVDPSSISEGKVRPEVSFLELRIDGMVILPGNTDYFDKSILVADQLTIPPDVSVMELAFAALDYANPKGNRFQFQLEGYDEDWRDNGSLGAVMYTNLSPGHYTFNVRAASQPNDWGAVKSIRIHVLPPWWRTIWAYFAYGLVLIGGIVMLGKQQRARIAAEERRKVQDRELEQAREIERQHSELTSAYASLQGTQAQLVEQEKLASLGSLTAGIAHEIKNPLNFVNNFAEVGAEMADELSDAISAGQTEEAKSIISELKENALQIAKHGKRADSIVRAMMQHARGGASEKESIDLNTFLEEYINLAWHGMRARDNDFQAEVHRNFSEVSVSLSVMPQELGRVVLNLLNNAFDAVKGRPDGEVVVRTGVRNEGVPNDANSKSAIEIRVSDNGPGIPEDIRAKIFEPFFTTKATGEGTGLGLSLSYDIVTKGHGGTMEVGTSAAGGAEFIVTLPY